MITIQKPRLCRLWTMATTQCWRCLARRSTPAKLLVSASNTLILRPATATRTRVGIGAGPTWPRERAAAFSTSAASLASDKGGDGLLSKHIRAGKKMKLTTRRKKKGHKKKTKPVVPGERKAFRKRIQLSNDNALPVSGLEALEHDDALADPTNVGKMMALPPELQDQLRAVEAFKATQNWGLFRSPHMLVRECTGQLCGQLRKTVGEKKTARVVITGDKGTGKSMLGLQALTAGFMNNWLVIHLAEGQDLSNARTEYAPTSDPTIYSQPTHIIKLMQSLYTSNRQLLLDQKVSLDHYKVPITVPRGMSLATLANLTKEPEFAWPIFMALWRELLLPGRPPILFCLDGLQHIMGFSQYRNPAYELIHSHDLGILRLYTDALTGKTKFPNGAAVIGVTSASNEPKNPSFDVALRQAVFERPLFAPPPEPDTPFPQRDPFYMKYDERVFEAMSSVEVLRVGSVSKNDARALMEYWAASGVLRMRVDAKTVSERWTLAGSGVLAELERASLWALRL